MRAKIMTLDANVFLAALKYDEEHSERCVEILRKVPGDFVLAEPSVIYGEVCGTLARKVNVDVARKSERFLDSLIHPRMLFSCDDSFCRAAYPLCHEYGVYSIDALYLKVALDTGAILVSLDEEGFLDRVRRRSPKIEVYHVSEFPY